MVHYNTPNTEGGNPAHAEREVGARSDKAGGIVTENEHDAQENLRAKLLRLGTSMATVVWLGAALCLRGNLERQKSAEMAP